MVLRIARVERNREQPLLTARADEPMDVEERLRAPLAVDEHPDHAALLDHVEPAALAAGSADEDRRVEAGCERAQAGMRGGAAAPPAPAGSRRPRPAAPRPRAPR